MRGGQGRGRHGQRCFYANARCFSVPCLRPAPSCFAPALRRARIPCPKAAQSPADKQRRLRRAPARGAQALSDHYWIAASPELITRGSANSAGFYQIIMQNNGRSNLLFTDHAAEKQVYLCSTPSCEHSDASCSSFIDSAGYYVFPVALEDKLLVVYSYIALPDEAPKPSKVEIMDLNGHQPPHPVRAGKRHHPSGRRGGK